MHNICTSSKVGKQARSIARAVKHGRTRKATQASLDFACGRAARTDGKPRYGTQSDAWLGGFGSWRSGRLIIRSRPARVEPAEPSFDAAAVSMPLAWEMVPIDLRPICAVKAT